MIGDDKVDPEGGGPAGRRQIGRTAINSNYQSRAILPHLLYRFFTQTKTIKVAVWDVVDEIRVTHRFQKIVQNDRAWNTVTVIIGKNSNSFVVFNSQSQTLHRRSHVMKQEGVVPTSVVVWREKVLFVFLLDTPRA